MNVDRRMIGRELPCTLSELLGIDLAVGEMNDALLAGKNVLSSTGWMHLRRGELGLARARLMEAVVSRSECLSGRLGLALACEGLGQHDQAAAQLDALLAVDAVWEADGVGGAATGEATGERRAARGDGFCLSRYGLLCAAGFALERSGEWRMAKARYVAALSASPTNLFALHRLIAVHLSHGEAHEAIACLMELLMHRPQDLTARITLAHLLRQAGREAEAVWEYQQAICLQPETWEVNCEVGSQEHAVSVLEQLASAQPQFPDLRMRLGDLYSRLGEDEAARAAYREALAMHPEYLDCYIALARHERQMGRFADAADHLRRAMQINHQNSEIFAALALSLRGQEAQQAKEMLASAARISLNSAHLAAQVDLLSGEHPELWLNDVDGERLWVETLIQRYEAAIDVRPEALELRLRLAMLQRLAGQSERACHTLREAVAREPDSRPAWLQCGLALAEMGNSPFAFDALERALYFDEAALELECQLALVYCGSLEFDLTLERMEAQQADAARRVDAVLEQMQLTGLTGKKRDVTVGVG